MSQRNESGVPGSSVSLRKFPYPYVAAASITGDLDDLESRDDFVELVRFWNTSDVTALGPGLDLDLGHSFWFYDATGACDVTSRASSSAHRPGTSTTRSSMLSSPTKNTSRGSGNRASGSFFSV